MRTKFSGNIMIRLTFRDNSCTRKSEHAGRADRGPSGWPGPTVTAAQPRAAGGPDDEPTRRPNHDEVQAVTAISGFAGNGLQ